MKTSNSGRVYTQAKRKRQGGLKECELGTKCPYQNEYQHNLEFCHNKDPQTIRSEAVFNSGGGVKLGGREYGGMRVGGAMVNTAPDRSIGANARGHRLGGGSSGVRYADNRHGFGGAMRNPEKEKSNMESEIFCENCFQLISAHAYVDHVEEHLALLSATSASSSSSLNETKRLRAAQDDEYEASMLADLEREEVAQHEERRKRNEALLAQEEQALQEAIAESERSAAIATRQHATDSLLPEPPNGDHSCVQLRFTLPCGRKVMRRFLKNSSVQQAFHFLRSLDSPTASSSLLWALRHVVGSDSIGASESRSFNELGLSSSCSLVALQLDPTVNNVGFALVNTPPFEPAVSAGPTPSPKRLGCTPPSLVVDLLQSSPPAPSTAASAVVPSRQQPRVDVVDLTSP